MPSSAIRFGQCLSRILQEKEISLQGLAELTGYRSKTSLARILRGEVSPKNLAVFLKRFQEAGIGDAADIGALTAALSVAQMGEDRYAAWQGLWDLFHAPIPAPEPEAREEPDALERLVDSVRSAEGAELLVVNCCDPGITARLAPVFCAGGGRPLVCEHYFHLTESVSRTVRMIASLLALAPHAQYSGRAMKLDGDGALSLGVLGGDLIACRLVSREGVRTEQVCLFHRDSGAVRVELTGEQGVYEFLRRAVGAWKPRCQTVSQPFPAVVCAEDYVRLSEMLADLEWKKTMYLTEPGPCLHSIPPEIAVGALQPDLLERMLENGGDYGPLMARFAASHARRYQNLFNNNCAKHIILSRSGAREFAFSGRLRGHFFAMRGFTAEERISILQNYLDHARKNGHFNVYFWQDDGYALNRGLICFENHALSLFDPDSDFSDNPNMHALFVEPTISALVSDYFRRELLAKRVLPYGEGLAFLERLIDEIRRRPAPE